MTLLGKSRRLPSNAMGGSFCRGMSSVPLAFKRHGQDRIFDLPNRVKISFTSVGNSTGRWHAGSLSDNTHPLEYNKRPIFSLALGWRHWRGQTISPN
jgi:hypothetical protein